MKPNLAVVPVGLSLDGRPVRTQDEYIEFMQRYSEELARMRFRKRYWGRKRRSA
jgi:hypothetical protein